MPKIAVRCCQRSPMKWPPARAYHPGEPGVGAARCTRTTACPPTSRWRPAMTVEFGLALENFTPERKVPDMDAITAYSATAEELGFASVWAWDHLFLGARRP